jgi:hypothetical protein
MCNLCEIEEEVQGGTGRYMRMRRPHIGGDM